MVYLRPCSWFSANVPQASPEYEITAAVECKTKAASDLVLTYEL